MSTSKPKPEDVVPITTEYLDAVRKRALLNNPTAAIQPGCTCAACARIVLLNEVERLRGQVDAGSAPS